MPETYDAETTYDVEFKRPVTRGPFRYLPRDKPAMKGSALNKIVEEHGADVVRTAVAR